MDENNNDRTSQLLICLGLITNKPPEINGSDTIRVKYRTTNITKEINFVRVYNLKIGAFSRYTFARLNRDILDYRLFIPNGKTEEFRGLSLRFRP